MSIAFSARPFNVRSYDCENMEPGIFDDILTDTTENYNRLSSSYTCPVKGSYMFTLTLNNFVDTFVRGNIMVDDFTTASVNCGDDRNQASNSVIWNCRAGERVWVRIHCSNTTELDDWTYVNFSGFFIK